MGEAKINTSLKNMKRNIMKINLKELNKMIKKLRGIDFRLRDLCMKLYLNK